MEVRIGHAYKTVASVLGVLEDLTGTDDFDIQLREITARKSKFWFRFFAERGLFFWTNKEHRLTNEDMWVYLSENSLVFIFRENLAITFDHAFESRQVFKAVELGLECLRDSRNRFYRFHGLLRRKVWEPKVFDEDVNFYVHNQGMDIVQRGNPPAEYDGDHPIAIDYNRYLRENMPIGSQFMAWDVGALPHSPEKVEKWEVVSAPDKDTYGKFYQAVSVPHGLEEKVYLSDIAWIHRWGPPTQKKKAKPIII